MTPSLRPSWPFNALSSWDQPAALGRDAVISGFWRRACFPRGPAVLHVAALGPRRTTVSPGVASQRFGSTLGPHRPGPAAGAAPLARACLFLAEVLSLQSPSGWDGGSHADFVQQHFSRCRHRTPAAHGLGQNQRLRSSRDILGSPKPEDQQILLRLILFIADVDTYIIT